MELFILFALQIFQIFVKNFNISVYKNFEICQIVDLVDILEHFANFMTFGQHAKQLHN